MSNKHTY